MSKLISDLFSYIYSVFVDGIQKLFTVFDFIGVAIILFPNINNWINISNFQIKSIGSIIIIASFLIANFNLYRKYSLESKLKVDISSKTHCSFSGDNFIFKRGEASLSDNINLSFQVNANISNSGPVTSIRALINSIEPRLLPKDFQYSTIAVKIRHKLTNNRIEELENPHHLAADDMKDIQLLFDVKLTINSIEEYFGCLNKFRKINVIMAIQQTGKLPIIKFVAFDLTSAQKDMEERIASQLQHLQNYEIGGSQIMNVIKRYYGIKYS